MRSRNWKSFFLTSITCALVLALPTISHAAQDEELALMRAQLQALSERLDRLEAENRELAAANERLTLNSQDTMAAVAQVSEKTEAVAAEVEEQGSKTDWRDRVRWKGDFRYRYENIDIEGKPGRNRNRVRARATLIAGISPELEVGLGIASGGDDPLSTNQTLGDGNSTKGLNLDLAYFDWSGLNGAHVIGGKFSNFLYKSGKNSLLWDGDWRPEGMGIKWSNGKFFANGIGAWIESDSKNDQLFAYGLQGGLTLPVGDNVKLTAGIGYYDFDTGGSGSFYGDDDDFFDNSFDPITNTYLFDYEELQFFADIGFSLLGRPVLLFADYVQNQAVDSNDTAYMFGFNFGKAKNKGEWEFGYVYKKLEADSVFGLLTDSDFGGGGTDSKGHILKGSYAIMKNWNANVTYLFNESGLKSGNPTDYDRLQLDLSFKY